MPNWVYNNITGITPEIYDKYKSTYTTKEGNEVDTFDFNKIDPMPEELNNTTSPSNNELNRAIYEFKNSEDEVTKFNAENHINRSYRDMNNYTLAEIGTRAFDNPDKSLNQILRECETSSEYPDERFLENVSLMRTIDNAIDKSVKYPYSNPDNRKIVVEKFIEYKEAAYANSKHDENFPTLESKGKYSKELIDKYGFDNWYDWRLEHWGVKWNASDSIYNPDDNELRFDTPWGIPKPIVKQLALRHPDTEMNIYSEEETGWFEEADLKNGQVIIKESGQILYDEEADETTTEFDDPAIVEANNFHYKMLKVYNLPENIK